MTRQEALDVWRRLHFQIWTADRWFYVGRLVAERNKIAADYNLTIKEKRTGKIGE